MKHICKCALRSYMTRCLTDARKQSHLTQARFSEKLMMDTRSYADLEHGKSLCCTLTFIIYLIQDLRKIIIASYENDRSAS